MVVGNPSIWIIQVEIQPASQVAYVALSGKPPFWGSQGSQVKKNRKIQPWFGALEFLF